MGQQRWAVYPLLQRVTDRQYRGVNCSSVSSTAPIIHQSFASSSPLHFSIRESIPCILYIMFVWFLVGFLYIFQEECQAEEAYQTKEKKSYTLSTTSTAEQGKVQMIAFNLFPYDCVKSCRWVASNSVLNLCWYQLSCTPIIYLLLELDFVRLMQFLGMLLEFGLNSEANRRPLFCRSILNLRGVSNPWVTKIIN
jgi:hypothetical protein